jgi:hypothetical protein
LHPAFRRGTNIRFPHTADIQHAGDQLGFAFAATDQVKATRAASRSAGCSASWFGLGPVPDLPLLITEYTVGDRSLAELAARFCSAQGQR